jgi:hypothetical protein
MAILLSRLLMPSRVEDLEQRFCRSKGAINEIFYEALECFIKWASPWYWTFRESICEAVCKNDCRDES